MGKFSKDTIAVTRKVLKERRELELFRAGLNRKQVKQALIQEGLMDKVRGVGKAIGRGAAKVSSAFDQATGIASKQAAEELMDAAPGLSRIAKNMEDMEDFKRAKAAFISRFVNGPKRDEDQAKLLKKKDPRFLEAMQRGIAQFVGAFNKSPLNDAARNNPRAAKVLDDFLAMASSLYKSLNVDGGPANPKMSATIGDKGEKVDIGFGPGM
tara:strand:+ start:367 stop:999 length:633 start_codon:yes stop_codon:yes gene_type:complete